MSKWDKKGKAVSVMSLYQSNVKVVFIHSTFLSCVKLHNIIQRCSLKDRCFLSKCSNFSPCHSKFLSRCSNFSPCHSKFLSRCSNFSPCKFLSKCSNFSPCHSKFLSKCSNFSPCNSKFLSKCSNFSPCHTKLHVHKNKKKRGGGIFSSTL